MLMLGRPSVAWALDIWLVTNQNRILVIRHVEQAPVQEVVLVHDPVPDALRNDFGDLAFALDGNLYGISMTYGVPAQLYRIDLTTGGITPVGPTFPFEWGNALEFDPRTGRAYTGGGLLSANPYRFLDGFYIFDNLDPATTTLWYDLTADYPNGGFTGDYAFANGHLYAIWGIWNGAAYEHYLFQVEMDPAGNPVSYVNLGYVEGTLGAASKGIWGLASDGHVLYATTPWALYRVDVSGGTASYTKIIDYTLNPGEEVNGATTRWADLSLTLTSDVSTLHPGETAHLTLTVANAGPYPADSVVVAVTLPAGVTFQSASSGNYDPATNLWTLPAPLAVGASLSLDLTVQVLDPGAWTVQAQIVAAGPADVDSATSQGFDVDDLSDGLPDDDEAQVRLVALADLPAAGFPQREGLQPSLRAAAPKSMTRAASKANTPWLEIPALGVQATILGVPLTAQGWDVAWLGRSVGWLEGSAFPTWVGNTVLAGHVWNADNTPGIFAGLKTLQYGERVVIHAWGQRYVYEVRKKCFLNAAESERLFVPQTHDWLTLLTCTEYDPAAEQYRKRLAVCAVLVAVEPEAMEALNGEDAR